MNFGIALADKALDDAIGPDKITEINREMRELTSLQARLDAAIAKLPEGADKARVVQKRAEARGYFDSYVLPAYMALYSAATKVQGGASDTWNSIVNWWDGLFSGADFGSGQRMSYQLGAIPLLPVGWVAAASVVALSSTAIYYIKQQAAREKAILEDPAFTPQQKKELLEGGTVSGILKNAQSLIVVGGIVGIVYLAYRNKSK